MKSLKIVIADNESVIRMDVREMLEEAGHEVVGEAVNGKKAVELARRCKPDLCILDVKMPEMDGITAAKIITEEKIAPVLLLTAFSQADMVKRATEAGVLAYLVKPVQESNLFPAIEVALSRYQEMHELEDELFKLRFQQAVNQLDNPMRISAVKKDIARILTVQRDIELHGTKA